MIFWIYLAMQKPTSQCYSNTIRGEGLCSTSNGINGAYCIRRVDIIHTSEGWRKLHDIGAQEVCLTARCVIDFSPCQGIVSIAYERKYGPYSRMYQFTKLFLFNPSSAIYTCPLAMSDGAARLLELYGTEQEKREVIPRLISRDPSFCWTSGQWVRLL